MPRLISIRRSFRREVNSFYCKIKTLAVKREVTLHIHLLVKVDGLTLEGAAKRLKGDRREVITKAKVLDSLRSIREQLAEIRETL